MVVKRKISILVFLLCNFREEVLREQFGIRLRATQDLSSFQQASANNEPLQEPQEVSPEFLAALPLEVQQEV